MVRVLVHPKHQTLFGKVIDKEGLALIIRSVSWQLRPSAENEVRCTF